MYLSFTLFRAKLPAGVSSVEVSRMLFSSLLKTCAFLLDERELLLLPKVSCSKATFILGFPLFFFLEETLNEVDFAAKVVIVVPGFAIDFDALSASAGCLAVAAVVAVAVAATGGSGSGVTRVDKSCPMVAMKVG